jgi:hypothetical protein
LTVARSLLARVRAAGTACTCSFHNTASHAPCPTPPKLHCNGNSVYIFLFWELRGLSPNFHIHVSMSDLYIPRIGPHISSSRKCRTIHRGNIQFVQRHMMWKLELRPRYSFSGNICFKFSAFCLCSVSKTIPTGIIDYGLCKLLNFRTKSSVYV